MQPKSWEESLEHTACHVLAPILGGSTNRQDRGSRVFDRKTCEKFGVNFAEQEVDRKS